MAYARNIGRAAASARLSGLRVARDGPHVNRLRDPPNGYPRTIAMSHNRGLDRDKDGIAYEKK